MNIINEFKDEMIELMFDKWKLDKLEKKTCEIVLADFTNPKEESFKDTKYFIFTGCFLEDNYHKIMKLKPVKFWFTKRAFKNAVIRVVDFNTLKTDKKYKLICKITRVNRLQIILSDVIVQDYIILDFNPTERLE